MKKISFLSIFSLFLLFALISCSILPVKQPIPTKGNPYLEEEVAAQEIATHWAEQTQAADRVSPYIELSNGEQTFLAFWFKWNGETVFLPIEEFLISDSGLASCIIPEAHLVIGKPVVGATLDQGECNADTKALENAPPVIRIPNYFEDGIHSTTPNIIDTQGQPAHNLSEVVTFIIENDLTGSGDLVLSLYRTDGPKGEPLSETNPALTYRLPVEALQITFTKEQLDNFEYVYDITYTLRRSFTWKIPAGHEELKLVAGEENWFILFIDENGRKLEKIYLQIKY